MLFSIVLLGLIILGAALVFWPLELREGTSRFSSNQNDLIENRGSSISQAKSGEFVIESGQSLGATARKLAEHDLVVNRVLFVFYSILTGHEKDFKAGRYVLPERVSIRDLVNIFSEGLSEPDDIVITIPEGWNTADIDKILSEKGLIKKRDLLTKRIFRSGDFSISAYVFQEGRFFPDTYHFKKPDKTPDHFTDAESAEILQEIVLKIGSNFDMKTEKLFDNFSQREISKVVIVASILEKEVQTEEDMRLVAGIIKKRLELEIPLQVDATVAYGVCFPEFMNGRYCDVSLVNIVDNLKIDSEYNTYVRRGLPIGPISNPGLKAIRAALNPEPSEYLFYLSAKDGTTIFSKTATEHKRNRAKYLK